MSAFEYTPVDKTCRTPAEMLRRRRNRTAAEMARVSQAHAERRLTEIEIEAIAFRDLKATRDMAILAGNTSAPISIKLVMMATAQHFQIPVSALKGPSREMVFVRPRQIAFYLANEFTDFSLTAIGQQFMRDHTTVLHGIRIISGKIAAGDAAIVAAIEAITEAIEP